jgi:2-polyprenyl-6-methoxyphenol hydroxylase-like FAD-dependent oxidoreductase
MRRITVVGGGQAGLVLAMGLRQHGYQVRLAQNRSAEAIRTGKVLSSQCVFANARAEERSLGLDLWANSAPAIAGIRIQVAAPDGSGAKVIGFDGLFTGPAHSIDQRLKFSTLMQVFEQKGGGVEICDVGIAELERFAADSDLVVVAAGKAELSNLFARDPARSPFDKPMRALALVYVSGMEHHAGPLCVTATLVPGVGELFMIPALTLSGPCDILFFEGIPGGPLDCFDARADVDTLTARIKELIGRFIPWEAERIANVTPTDANAALVGRFAPAVRHGAGLLPSGRPVLGLADTIALSDPIVGQGANNAIHAAKIYLDAITARGNAPFDEAWMTTTAEAAQKRVEASVQWSNMMLLPPPEHAIMLLGKAVGSPTLANRIANGFDEPSTILPLFADPAQAAAA